MDANQLKGHLDLILLSMLEGTEMYGLEITKAVQERTDGLFTFSVGSLYPALHRLERAGFITGEFRDAPRGGSPVKYYRLSDSGGRELQVRKREFKTFSDAVQGLWTRSSGI
jgi:DNA-binding PadR family transcriptional regulator